MNLGEIQNFSWEISPFPGSYLNPWVSIKIQLEWVEYKKNQSPTLLRFVDFVFFFFVVVDVVSSSFTTQSELIIQLQSKQ